MEESMEVLETVCDTVAIAIDDANGDLQKDEINDLVVVGLGPTTYSREQFDEMFGNIYCCGIYEYASNAADDANWASEQGLLIDEELDETLSEVDPEDLGLSIETEDSFVDEGY